MTYDPPGELENNRSPCSFFCLWTHLHGWRHFALAKNKGYWLLWIVIFIITIFLSGANIYSSLVKFYAYDIEQHTRYGEVTHYGKFPAVTLCRETYGLFNEDMCAYMGVSVAYKGSVVNNVTMNSSVTDQGQCCTIYAKDDMPSVGRLQGLKIWAYPGLGQNGLYFALHHPEDSPLMNAKSEFLAAGTDNDIKVNMIHSRLAEPACMSSDAKFTHAFGSGKRASKSNCLYDNMMSEIAKTCNCDKLANCSATVGKWNCTAKILMDPYSRIRSPIECKEACTDMYYMSTVNSKKWAKNPPLCKRWLSVALRNLTCIQNQTTIETSYSGLCNSATLAYNTCPVDEGLEKYENFGTLQQFAKDRLVGLTVYTPDYWIPITEFYFRHTFSSLVAEILIILTIYFGFSVMSIPEMLYYAFMSRGGGCFCSPIVKACS